MLKKSNTLDLPVTIRLPMSRISQRQFLQWRSVSTATPYAKGAINLVLVLELFLWCQCFR